MATSEQYGLFLPTTSNFDVGELYSTDVDSLQFKELLVRLYQDVSNIAIAINLKESGYYPLTEFVTGQLLFPNPALTSTTAQTPEYRQVFRLTLNVGALNAGVTNVAHNLTIQSTWSFLTLYGAASNTTTGNYYPLPFASAGGATNIEVRANNTNVVITNNSGVTFTRCYIVLEYIKE